MSGAGGAAASFSPSPRARPGARRRCLARLVLRPPRRPESGVGADIAVHRHPEISAATSLLFLQGALRSGEVRQHAPALQERACRLILPMEGAGYGGKGI